MNHQFTSSKDNKAFCQICNRDFISHTSAAKCEKCNRTKECEVYETEPNILQCWDCYDKRLHAVLNKIGPTKEAQKIIDDAREIDNSINFNGDLFNACTISHIELHKAYLNNTEIEEKDREGAFQKHLAERYDWLKEHVFKIQDEIGELQKKQVESFTEQKAIAKSLRELGNDLRDEIRNKLKEHDQNYKPLAIVKPTLVTARGKNNKGKTNTDMLIEQIMLFHGVDRETAKDKVMAMQKERDKVSAMDKVVDAYIQMHPNLTKEQALEIIRKGQTN